MAGAMSNQSAERLPDLLHPGLKLVFVGTAASRISAARGAYYANRQNRFWRTLHEIGLTPRLFAPEDWPLLAALGIGLTDLSKTGAGMDHEIDPESFDIAGFNAKIAAAKPKAIAFTSKRGASLWSGRPTGVIPLGLQPGTAGPAVFVLCSPSSRAGSYWQIEPWQALADWVRVLPA
jgi:TDG/mug DNA glycosylase family protein